MGLKPGMTNNPAGRPKGTANVVTKELREQLKEFVSFNWKRFERDFKKLKPLERAQLFEKLLKFVIPAMKESDVNFNLERLTDEQLNQLIDKIISNDQQ
jgi:ribosome-binding ATPase YchF (GTP1/OBG family)